MRSHKKLFTDAKSIGLSALLDRIRESLVCQSLSETGFNVAQASKLLQANRTTVLWWIEKYGLEEWVDLNRQKLRGPEKKFAPDYGHDWVKP